MSTSETLGQVKHRQKQELRDAESRIKTYRKNAKKSGLNKKEIESNVQSMQDELREKHDKELSVFETLTIRDETVIDSDIVASSVSESKAFRRRERKKQQEKERIERIKRVNESVCDQRDIEMNKILQELSKAGLTIHEMPSDGDCMYYSVMDQINSSFVSNGKSPKDYTVVKLRQITAEYMRAHKEDFMPFMAFEETEAMKSAEAAFDEHCDRVALTSEWGGQLELRALTHALKRAIYVYSAEPNVIKMGEEYEGPPLKITYHLHYYALGEHYNSTRAL